MTFEVGGDAVAQYYASPWTGAMIGAGDAGTQFAATDVTSVVQRGDAVDLLVATNDPSGREVLVRIDPTTAGPCGSR